METVAVKYTFPRLYFAEPVPLAQTFKVEYRKVGALNWVLNPTNLVTNNVGIPENDCVIYGLDPDSDYDVRLTNTINNAAFTKTIHTAFNIPMGDSPLYLKRIYPGQTIDMYTPGLLASSLPPNFNSFYYILEQNYRDAYAGFSNAIPRNGIKWDVLTDSDNPARKATGASIGEGRYVELNNEAAPEARVNAATIFGDGTRAFSWFVWFYLKDLTTAKTVISTKNINGEYWRVWVDTGGVCRVESFSLAGGLQTARTPVATPLSAGHWYCLEMTINHDHPNYNSIVIYPNSGAIPFDDATTIANTMVGYDDTVYLGYDVVITTPTASEGLAIRRTYYARTDAFDNNSRYRIVYPQDYLPKLVFDYGGGVTFITNVSWSLKLDDSVFSTAVDPATPTGTATMKIQTSTGTTFEHAVEVIPFSKKAATIDVNFAANFDGALTVFRDNFYAFESQWGGANGGTRATLIYADRTEGALVFEQHGDNYTGEVQGVMKPYKNDQNTGYGAPKIHDIPDDPQYLQPWLTRVGAVAVSKDYCGYGVWDTWLKIPVGCYGVAPALWFFHYQEYYQTDVRWDTWIAKGGKPYGGADPYMVINHEIDIELPSHLTQGVFAEWNEVSLAYFDPLALDTQYRIAVQNAPLAADNGLFRLTNVASPNARASWVKESDTWDILSTPKFSNCKFNSWIGEKSAGNGWAYSESDYEEGEEYLALLTKLNQSYADGQYHKWTIKWYKDHTELWIDDVHIRDNRAFTPYIPGRLTFGGWFPSGVASNSSTPWQYSPSRAWAGYPAGFKFLHLHVQRVRFTPFSDAEAGGANELYSETYPEAGLREFLE